MLTKSEILEKIIEYDKIIEDTNKEYRNKIERGQTEGLKGVEKSLHNLKLRQSGLMEALGNEKWSYVHYGQVLERTDNKER